MRVFWEHFDGKPDNAEIHLDIRIPKLVGGDPPPMLANMTSDNPEEYGEFVDDLSSVPGLMFFVGSYYSIMVAKGRVFRWDEIKARVERIILDRFDPDGMAIHVDADGNRDLSQRDDPSFGFRL